MAVEIDADAGPVQPRRHLLDMGRLAGAVIALTMTRRFSRSPPGSPAWCRDRSGKRDRSPAHADRPRNRPAPQGRCRYRTPAVPTPSYRAIRRARAIWSWRRSSSILRGLDAPETRYALWLKMGASWNLSESDGRQKPAARSKFRRIIIKIGADPGFWKAALRIMLYFLTQVDPSVGRKVGIWHPFPALPRVMLAARPTRAAVPCTGSLWLPSSIN